MGYPVGPPHPPGFALVLDGLFGVSHGSLHKTDRLVHVVLYAVDHGSLWGRQGETRGTARLLALRGALGVFGGDGDGTPSRGVRCHGSVVLRGQVPAPGVPPRSLAVPCMNPCPSPSCRYAVPCPDPCLSPPLPLPQPLCLPRPTLARCSPRGHAWFSTSMAMSTNMSCSSLMLLSSRTMSLCRPSISLSACFEICESTICRGDKARGVSGAAPDPQPWPHGAHPRGEDGGVPALQHLLQLLIRRVLASCGESALPQALPTPLNQRGVRWGRGHALISSCLWIRPLLRSLKSTCASLYLVITSTNLRDRTECWGWGHWVGDMLSTA